MVAPHIRRLRYTRVCEIGAQLGSNTDRLASLPGVDVTVIDPCLDLDLEGRYRDDENVTIERGASLEVLANLTASFDCFLIDGDHNWYTVLNELRTIESRALLRSPGTIFLHDTSWPYARRDLYYRPEALSPDVRQQYAKGGVVRGQNELDPRGLNADLFHATREGGPRNGVLTAIEDYLAETHRPYRFLRLQREFGLGVLLFGAARDARLEWRARLHSWRRRLA